VPLVSTVSSLINQMVASERQYQHQFVGNMFNLFLYGALTVQLCMPSAVNFSRCCQSFADLYYTYFPKDPRPLKTVVCLVYLTETVHTVLLLYDLGNSLLSFLAGNYFNFFLLSSIVIPVCGAIGACLTPASG